MIYKVLVLAALVIGLLLVLWRVSEVPVKRVALVLYTNGVARYDEECSNERTAIDHEGTTRVYSYQGSFDEIRDRYRRLFGLRFQDWMPRARVTAVDRICGREFVFSRCELGLSSFDSTVLLGESRHSLNVSGRVLIVLWDPARSRR